jgi:hypothetical protein
VVIWEVELDAGILTAMGSAGSVRQLGPAPEVANRVADVVFLGRIAALKGGAGRPGKEKKNSMFVVCVVRCARDAVLPSESLG